jgi:8-oxo-dGTP pyrophosphatase MutT (NUDIX family)
MNKRATYRAAVYVIPIREQQILLSQRHNTGFGDGFYSFIAGHIENGESATDTAIREAAEEADIVIARADLHFAHILHRHTEDGFVYFDFFFTLTRWQGIPTLMEPHRCSELRWAAWDRLPEKTLPYVCHVVDHIFNRATPFSEFGWRQSHL